MGNVICEVGVNMPNYSKAIQTHKRGDRIILIEPVKECCEELYKYCEKHGIEAAIHNFAIWSHEAPLTMLQKDQNCLSGYVQGVESPLKTRGYKPEEIRTIKVEGRIFSCFDPGNIDILFLDAEGCEWYVLKTMKSRPKIIRIEMAGIKYVNPYFSEITKWLEENNYFECLDLRCRSDRVYERR